MNILFLLIITPPFLTTFLAWSLPPADTQGTVTPLHLVAIDYAVSCSIAKIHKLLFSVILLLSHHNFLIDAYPFLQGLFTSKNVPINLRPEFAIV